MGVLDFFTKTLPDTYNKYKGIVDTATSIGKGYVDYKEAKRRNEIEEAVYDDYMAAAEAAGQEAQAAIDLNLTPMTISNLPTKKADVTSFTKATGVKDGGIMRLKDGGRIGLASGANERYEKKIKELMDKGLTRELAEAIVLSDLSPEAYTIPEKKDGGIMKLKDGTPDPNEGITALRKVRPDVVAKMGLAGGGGPGIEALRKKAPEVVKRMGFAEGMNEEMIESVSYESGNYTDEEIEAYENYKYDMNEQKPGFPIMEIDDFLRFFMSPYSKKKSEMDTMMASAPDIQDDRNQLAMQLFGKTLDLLSAEEMEMLNDEADRLMQKFMAKGGIAAFKKGGRVKFSEGESYEIKFMKLVSELREAGFSQQEAIEEAKKQLDNNMAYGGRVKRNVGGMMDLGGMEKDYRFSGGFVPIGEYERKDDVPARLSKNEFVFTADAVRAAGGGSVKKGAKRMYDTMKNLEAKPQAKGMMA